MVHVLQNFLCPHANANIGPSRRKGRGRTAPRRCRCMHRRSRTGSGIVAVFHQCAGEEEGERECQQDNEMCYDHEQAELYDLMWASLEISFST